MQRIITKLRLKTEIIHRWFHQQINNFLSTNPFSEENLVNINVCQTSF